MTNDASLDRAAGDTLLLLEADGDPKELFWDTEVTDGCWEYMNHFNYQINK